MRSSLFAISVVTPFIFMTLLLTGCGGMAGFGSPYGGNVAYNPSDHVAPVVSGKRKVGKPYNIMGKWYYPISSSEGYREKGIASWYGEEFHGKKTANGEVYNMYDMTAAHTTLPLPTFVRVTNLENGRHIKVRVNDRGPFLRGRLIDMSYAGARALGFSEQGTAPVLVEAYPTDGSALGAPSTRYAADTKPAPRVSSTPPRSEGKGFTYRVSARDKASEKAPAKEKAEAKEAPTQTDISEPEVATVKVPIYVQTGAFSDKNNADRQKKALSALYNNAKVMQTVVNGNQFYRVRIGPLDTVDIADQVLGRLIHGGYKEAIIVID